MSAPSAKRRKLNNHSHITPKDTHVDLDGVLSLAEALLMERQCIIALLKYRKNINLSKFIEWIFKIKAEQTSIVTALQQCFERSLNSIESLKEVNQTLNKERNELIHFLNDDIINNLDEDIKISQCIGKSNKCYDLMTKRIAIIHQLINKDSNVINRNKYTENKHHADTDDSEDSDLEVVESNKAKRCPLTQSIIKIPKRSIQCNHVFESFAIIEYIINKETNIYYFAEIQCPVCTQKITLNDLITDYSMIKWLKHVNVNKQRMLDLTEDEEQTKDNHNTDIIKQSPITPLTNDSSDKTNVI